MLAYLKSLMSEFFGIYSSIFDSEESDEASEEAKRFISLVLSDNYTAAAEYLVLAVKEAKDLDIDDMALHADTVGLDLTKVNKVIDAIRAGFTLATKTAYDPEHKAISILDGLLTYAHR